MKRRQQRDAEDDEWEDPKADTANMDPWMDAHKQRQENARAAQQEQKAARRTAAKGTPAKAKQAALVSASSGPGSAPSTEAQRARNRFAEVPAPRGPPAKLASGGIPSSEG